METSVKNRSVGNLQVIYDEEADVLYVAIGKPRPADSYEADNGVYVRRDPKTGDVVGATILDYRERFRRLSDVSWLASLRLPKELERYLVVRP